MQFPFKFNIVETFAEDCRVSVKYVDEKTNEFIRINHDLDEFGTILKNIKVAQREAKRQLRFKKKFERWEKRHTEKNQD